MIQIETPHPVYGLQWSADGERLAFCGGFLYGGGFVGLADRSGRLLGLRDPASLVSEPLIGGPVILSSLCLDDSGQWLLAAACGYKWHTRGPLLFCIEDRLELVAAPTIAEDDDLVAHGGSATGVWIHRGELLVRYRALSHTDALRRWPAPDALHADESRAHLGDARIAVLDDVAWITKNLLRVYSACGTGAPIVPGSDARLIVNPHGLASVDLRDPTAVPGSTRWTTRSAAMRSSVMRTAPASTWALTITGWWSGRSPTGRICGGSERGGTHPRPGRRWSCAGSRRSACWPAVTPWCRQISADRSCCGERARRWVGFGCRTHGPRGAWQRTRRGRWWRSDARESRATIRAGSSSAICPRGMDGDRPTRGRGCRGTWHASTVPGPARAARGGRFGSRVIVCAGAGPHRDATF